MTEESTKEISEYDNPEWLEWYKEFQACKDDQVKQSRMIRDQILKSEQLSEDDKKVFKTVFEYVEKLIAQGKQLEPNLLKIYLKDLNGFDIDEMRIIRIFALISMCGFSFDK